jgi:hypothetical protein
MAIITIENITLKALQTLKKYLFLDILKTETNQIKRQINYKRRKKEMLESYEKPHSLQYP